MPPKIASYMSSPVITAPKDSNLAYIRDLMIRHKISKVVITEKDNVVGIISRSDFVRVAYNRKRYVKPLTEILAYEIMSSPVYAVQPSKTIKAAAQAMLKKGIGSLLVIGREEKPVGIITRTDLVRAYAERYHGRFKVREFMSTKVPVVHMTHSLYYVVDLMYETGINKVVVIDKGIVMGVITKADITFFNLDIISRITRHKGRRLALTRALGLTGLTHVSAFPLACDVMTPNPLTITPDEDLALAADVMVKHRIGTLPVVREDGKLVGLLTKLDILKALKSA